MWAEIATAIAEIGFLAFDFSQSRDFSHLAESGRPEYTTGRGCTHLDQRTQPWSLLLVKVEVQQKGVEAVGSTLAKLRESSSISALLKRAFHGYLTMHFDDTAYFVRVDWRPSA